MAGHWLTTGLPSARPGLSSGALPSPRPGAPPQSTPATFSGLKHPASRRAYLGFVFLDHLGYICVLFPSVFSACATPAAPSQSLGTYSEGGEGPGLCLPSATAPCHPSHVSGPLEGTCWGVPTSAPLFKCPHFSHLESCGGSSPMPRNHLSTIPPLVSFYKELRCHWLVYLQVLFWHQSAT